MKSKNKSIITIVVLLAVLTLYLRKNYKNSESILERHSLDKLTIEKVVYNLENYNGKNNTLSASIFYNRLVIKDNLSSMELPIPNDKFYLSIAPYINSTHECFIHSLTGCRGELVNETVNLKITNDDGEIIYQGKQKTYSNGFTGLWLPKNINGTLSIELMGKSVVSDISTMKDSPTCLTTLQLK